MKGVLVILLIALTTCKPVIRNHDLHSGRLDVSRYMSFGNSFTAAFLDGALSSEGQLSAYPNLLARQLQKVGGGEFLIPMMQSDSGCNWVPQLPTSLESFTHTLSKLTLSHEQGCDGRWRFHPRFTYSNGENLFDNQKSNSPSYVGGPYYNNLAVPVMKTTDLYTSGYGNFNILTLDRFNPYFWRFSSNQSQASVSSDAVRMPPTFATLWFGLNDLLPFALSGGNHTDFTWADIGDVGTFEEDLDSFIVMLKSHGAEVVLATIPDVIEFPFFTTVNPNGLYLSATEAASLSHTYGGYSQVRFQEGHNAYAIVDAFGSGQVRQVRPGEMLLLSIEPDSLLCGGWGSTRPIEREYVLDSVEVFMLSQATAAYNQIIRSLSDAHEVLVVDVDALFRTVKPGTVKDGMTFSFDWLLGGFFSLDGIHPTPRGQGLIANHFIEALNAHYDAAIPLVNVSLLRGNVFP